MYVSQTSLGYARLVLVLGQFFGTTIFLLSLSSALTVAIIKLHFSGEHGARVPAWLRTLVLDCIAKCLRLTSSVEEIGDGWQQKQVLYRQHRRSVFTR